jgi:hypothetical protein
MGENCVGKRNGALPGRGLVPLLHTPSRHAAICAIFFIFSVRGSENGRRFAANAWTFDVSNRHNFASPLHYSARNQCRHILALSRLFASPPVSSMSESVAEAIATCLKQSDLKRDSGFDGSSTGWTSWVHEPSVVALQETMDQITWSISSSADSNGSPDPNDWFRWCEKCPTPMIIEFSTELRQAVHKASVLSSQSDSGTQDQGTELSLLSRIACRMIVLPSGSCLPSNLTTPPGGMIFGLVLRGGVTRYRLLGTRKRRAGERREVAPSSHSTAPSWLQYGGPERNYDAVDMGVCVLMEFILLPKGLSMPIWGSAQEINALMSAPDVLPPENTMIIGHPPVRLDSFLRMCHDNVLEHQVKRSNQSLATRSIGDALSTELGGLEKPIAELVRRVLDGRGLRSQFMVSRVL